MSFDPDVYARIRPGSQRSAAAVVPEVQRIVQARSVVDVGGGEGWWAAEFGLLGARAVCIDDGSATELADRVEHVRHDVSAGLPTNLGSFDLALSLEVLEHLDREAGDRLVGALCDLAPNVLFSAAVPGQGGHGHLNEQWPDYWVERFRSPRLRLLRGAPLELLGQRVGGVLVPTEPALRDAHSGALPRAVRDPARRALGRRAPADTHARAAADLEPTQGQRQNYRGESTRRIAPLEGSRAGARSCRSVAARDRLDRRGSSRHLRGPPAR